MRSLFLRSAVCVLAVLVWTGAVRAQLIVPITATVYVDAAAGDDASDGLTPATAWKTLDKVSVQTFGPGARILFRRGGTWTGSLAPKGAGAEGAPIRIGTYGTGARPVLSGGGAVLAVVSLFNQPYWEVEGLEITNFEANPPASPRRKLGVYVLARDMGAVRHTVLRDLVIRNINGPLDDDLDSQSRYYGGILLEVTGGTTPTYFDGVTVENNHLYDVDRSGISTKSDWENRSSTSTFGQEVAPGARDNWVPSRNVVIRGNLLERIGGNGIYVRQSAAPLVERNRVVQAGLKISGNALVCFGTDDALFQYNDVSGTVFNRAGQASYNHNDDTDAGGIDADFRTKRTIIQYNYLHRNGDGGVIATGGAGGATTYERFNVGTIVRYNILDRNDRIGIHLSGKLTGLVFHNNTVYSEASNNAVFSGQGSTPKVNVVDYTAWSGAWPQGDRYYNNLFVSGGSNQAYVLGSAQRIDFERNVYAGPGTFATPTTDSTKRTAPTAADLFVGAPGAPEGFRLREGSVAIGAGLRPPSFFADGAPPKDYFATPVGPTVDIGAHQRTVGTAVEEGVGVMPAAVRVWPNPATGAARVWLDAPRSGAVTVVVYDALGREAGRVSALVPAGESVLPLDLRAIGLAAGLYVVRVRQHAVPLGAARLVVTGGAR